MQESISRGGKIQFQTFDTSLYGTAHPNTRVLKIRILNVSLLFPKRPAVTKWDFYVWDYKGKISFGD